MTAGFQLPPDKERGSHHLARRDGLRRRCLGARDCGDRRAGGSDNLKKTYEQAPKHREPLYNDFCAAELDYGRGDDVLQICRLSLATAQRYMLKTVPPRSLPALFATLAFVALNRVVLPVTQWLSADRTWGILRPWRPSSSEVRQP